MEEKGLMGSGGKGSSMDEIAAPSVVLGLAMTERDKVRFFAVLRMTVVKGSE